jgi:hypothetical protein
MAVVLGAGAVLVAPGALASSREAPALVLSGAPLVHTFDLSAPGDAVAGTWQITSSRSDPVPFDGVLLTTGEVSPALARALTVEYGWTEPDGSIRWHAAGTLADPLRYGEALGTAVTVGATRPALAVPVRVSLPDPVPGTPGETVVVQASFVVSYLDPAGQDVDGGTGVLATTGGDLLRLLALAGAVIVVGLVTVRLRRSWADRAAAPTSVGAPEVQA